MSECIRALPTGGPTLKRAANEDDDTCGGDLRVISWQKAFVELGFELQHCCMQASRSKFIVCPFGVTLSKVSVRGGLREHDEQGRIR